jgi:arylsulfatase A-like enzyme
VTARRHRLASLVIGAAVAAALLGAACRDDAGPDAKSLVLITLDTTRRDALGAFGGPQGVTPALDAFAAECELYLGARTTAPLTLPAHASILTGLYPPRHTVRDNSLTPVPRTAVTLAEKAHDAGLRTGAVVAAAVLASPYGLDQGFDAYDEPERAAGDHS